MLLHAASPVEPLAVESVRGVLQAALDPLNVDGKRVLVIIPDGTRSAPIPLLFELLYAHLGNRVAQLDYLVALGTHAPMSPAAIDKLVGVNEAERAVRFPNVKLYNHDWANPQTRIEIGVIPAPELERLSDGLLARTTPVRINRMIYEYDQLIICGPVFPHEVVGFSGGAKYLFPGIAAGEIIDSTHWIGALATCMATIGIENTPTRRVIHRAAEFVDQPILCLALVMQAATLHGVYAGNYIESWQAAVQLSARLNIVYAHQPFRSVLSIPSTRYDDLWTAAKAMYKTEPVVADGGEIIIYAPHLGEVSTSHGAILQTVGYHVLPYFTKQWQRFQHYPGSVLAHSSHVKGVGSYDPATGVETPRIKVTLATAIPESVCRAIDLGYADYRTIDPGDWANREADGRLLVEHAGEVLYRLATRPEVTTEQ